MNRGYLCRAALALWVLLCVACASPPPASGDTSTRALHAFFDRHWAWVEQQFPEWGTFRGDHRHGDRLRDVSAAAQAELDARTRAWLAEARALSRAGLSATDRVSLDLFIAVQAQFVALQPFSGYRQMGIRANDGVQSELANLLSVTPVDSRLRVEQLLKRLAQVPVRMNDTIANLRRGAALGWVPPREVLDRALAQIDRQIAPALEEGPFYDPFRRLPATMSAAERAEFRAAGRAAIERDVLPAMRRLRAFVAGEYLARAPVNGALSTYPDGPQVYELLVRQQTTTTLSARQIHDIGLRELARLRGEIKATMREAKFDGDFAAFLAFLDSERFAYANAEAMLTHYRDIGKRLDGELPRLFAELPRVPWGVRAMPAHMSAERAEYYTWPATDGSRAGFFFANAAGWQRKRTWEAETLVAHEAVPGHHLQIARGQELKGLPAFRRNAFNPAFSEGWALYAETLGAELGLYRDPYAHFGHLQWQAFRAARLVVDTGYHAFGWSRERCIDFMVERTGVKRAFVTAEVDRYASQPGQALAYMIGRLEFDALRERARARLGTRFDIRRFHNAVLDQGVLPLTTLAMLVDEWIASEAAR